MESLPTRVPAPLQAPLVFLTLATVRAAVEITAVVVFGNLLILLEHRNVTLAPVNDQSLTDKEQHNSDLCNREEAPDAGLLHKVVRDKTGHNRAKQKEEASLQDHALLLVQGQEGGEHEE